MSIIIIKGGPKSGKTYMANALRTASLNNNGGALLIDEANNTEPKDLLGKLMLSPMPDKFPEGWEKAIKWKPNSTIILVEGKAELLNYYEKMLPGFKKHFGPTYTVTTGLAPLSVAK